MKAKMKTTLTNIKGKEFKDGTIVEVLKCWINNNENRIYIRIRLNNFEMITSAEHIEYI